MTRVWIAALGIAALVLGLALVTPTPRVEAQQPVDKEQVNAAVERGVAALKKMGPNGTWVYSSPIDVEKNTGVTALVGLALLNADVPKAELAAAANYVKGQAGNLTETYSIGLAIMFLDSYYRDESGKSPGATATIRVLADKLVKGQFQDGKWSYGGRNSAGQADLSNTQFAILGLWIARNHGVNVEQKLMLTEKTLRRVQNTEGGWSYGIAGPQGDPATPTMTCAGLLGLFLGFGVQKEKTAILRGGGDKPVEGAPAAPAPGRISLDDIRNDKQVQKALAYLTFYMQPGANIKGQAHWLYLLWSIERVGVTYQMPVINNVDWYNWGAGILLGTQGANGTWHADHGAAVDTSFALLFLKKADLVGFDTVIKSSATGSARPVAGGKPGASAKREEPKPVDLAQDLIKAGSKQSQMIDDFAKRKGPEFTQALADAIPKLGGSADKARLALRERLERLTLNSMRQYFTEDTNPELRRAAVIAAGRKGDEVIVPDLIPLLKDKDAQVSDAAYASLKMLTNKNFDKDPKPWSDWWKSKGSK